MGYSGKTFSVAAELTDASFLACWSQHHSTLSDFFLCRPTFISTGEPKVKQVPEPFLCVGKKSATKRKYATKMLKNKAMKNRDSYAFLTTDQAND